MPAPDFRRADLVTIEQNQDAFVVGLSGSRPGDGAYLIFQCALTPPDTQDVAIGMDTYCLLDETGAIHYGGVTRATLTDNTPTPTDATLTLALTDEAAEELGVENGAAATIEIAVPAADTARLAAGLNRIFTYGNPAEWPQLSGI